MYEPQRRVEVSYECPQCNNPIKCKLMWYKTREGILGPKTITGHWCDKCWAKNILEYKVNIREDGAAEVKELSLMSNGESHLKKIKILKWVGDKHV